MIAKGVHLKGHQQDDFNITFSEGQRRRTAALHYRGERSDRVTSGCLWGRGGRSLSRAGVDES